ncbi:MAG: CBS domain-containing protein [Acidobacteriota bacterium]
MDTIATLLRDKGGVVHTVPLSSTVHEAVEKMCALRVGALLVADEDGKVVGIFSERDVMARIILQDRNPSTTRLEEVLTRNVICVVPETRAEEAMAIMTEKRVRHLPVVSGGKVVGLVSIGDLVRWESLNRKFEIRMLTDYISGRYPA